jgi:hypothetical protein
MKVFIGSGKYTTMPRLSLYNPIKGNNYKFIDKAAWEMFQVGGVDVLIHKYLGPGDPSAADRSAAIPLYENDSPLNIQDFIFLENRDRKYDPDVYVMRGVYNIQDLDFNLSQFGLFLQNDTIFVTFHINDTVEKLGRKLISGDVIELPHLKDDHALNDLKFALKRFYVIEEVTRAAEGFSVTWYPHLYRAKCKPLVDSQEFKQILDQVADTDNFLGGWNVNVTYYPGDIVNYNGVNYEVVAEVTGTTPPNTTYYKLADSLRDIVSTYEREMQITQAVLDQAEADAPRSGYDTSMFYHVDRNKENSPPAVTTDLTDLDASIETQATDADGNLLFDANNNPVYVGVSAASMNESIARETYSGYLLGDGQPANGAAFTAGIAFPVGPVSGQFCLRKDYFPNRLFRFDGRIWRKVEDNLRHTMNNLGASDVGVDDQFAGKDVRLTQKTGFINNSEKTGDNALAFDVLIASANTNTVQTAVAFTVGMFAEVYLNETKINTTVAVGAGGNAVITLPANSPAVTGTRIQYRLYERSFNQKQGLSKALRPKAD